MDPVLHHPPTAPVSRLQWRLFTISFISLFLELMVIRWAPSVVRLIAYYANLMLISSFLGLGIGAMLANHKRRLFGWFPALLALEIATLWISQHYALPSSPKEARFYAGSSAMAGYVVLVAIFATNALTFVPLGQTIGEVFQSLPPLRAYSWDLGGSLAGTIVFGIFSFTHFSPVIGMAAVVILYLLLVPAARWMWMLPVFVGVLLTVWRSNDPNAVWSPYYYVSLKPMLDQYDRPSIDGPTVSEPVDGLRKMLQPPLYSVSVNHDFYQMHGTINLSRYVPGTNAAALVEELRSHYFLPFQIAPKHEAVVVLGAGGGTDVEAALLQGAKHVDAVEIDPRLVALSRRFNAADVYGSPQVTVHVDDARAFLGRADRKYDMVVFGFLDSQALFSYMTNLRLDGYIYTVESFRKAWDLLNDDGTLALSYTVSQPWLGEKLLRMVAQATGRVPLVYLDTKGSTAVMVVPRGEHLAAPASLGSFQALPVDQDRLNAINIPVATDDWPYLYLTQKTIPRDYLIVIGLLAGLSLLGLLGLRGRSFAAPDWHFLFMGLGFLLLETKSIGDCSLYFGATWLVTTIVVAGILLMVLAANLVAIQRKREFSAWLYAPLIASLLLLVIVPRSWILTLPLGSRFAWAILVIPLPIFFAGLIFSSTFRLGNDPAALLGANLIGAMIGGFCEYLGMLVGHQMLMFLVILAYFASLACVRKSRLPIHVH